MRRTSELAGPATEIFETGALTPVTLREGRGVGNDEPRMLVAEVTRAAISTDARSFCREVRCRWMV